MNKVVLKINPFSERQTITINGEPISKFSSLANVLNEPFLQWAHGFFDAVADELNDDFSLTIVSDRFEHFVLSQIPSDFCQSILWEAPAIQFSMKQRIGFVAPIAAMLGIPLPKFNDALGSARSRIASGQESQISFELSDDQSVSYEDGRYMFRLPEAELRKMLTVAAERMAVIPLFVEWVTKCQAKETALAMEQRSTLQLAKMVDPFLYAHIPEQLDADESAEVELHIYPQGQEIPRVRIEVSDNRVISVEGLWLRGLTSGETVVSLFAAGDLVPFAKESVRVVSHSFVDSIEISAMSTEMISGQTQSLAFTISPPDAEDAHELRWSSDTPDVVCVDEEGVVTALGAGTCIIRLSTRNASACMEFSVTAVAQAIQLSHHELDLLIGTTMDMEAYVFPHGSVNGQVQWFSSDKNVAVVMERAGFGYFVRTHGAGSCVLKCATMDGSVSATCNVRVRSTYSEVSKKQGVSWTGLALATGVAGGLFLVFTTMLPVALGCLGGAACMGVLGLVQKKKENTDNGR